jgi:hypothetical protein
MQRSSAKSTSLAPRLESNPTKIPLWAGAFTRIFQMR